MTLPTPEDAALLENHLAFTRWHRGTEEQDRLGIRIESTIPGFTGFIPLASVDAPGMADLLRAYERVRLVPWSGVDEGDLTAAGFAPAGALAYLTLADDAPARAGDLDIEVVDDAAAMEIFTDVQVHGFGATGEEAHRWMGWLGEANLRNLGHESQVFYVGRRNGEAAGVTLLLQTGSVGGIYAVATLPEHRRRGVSTALLRRAIDDARARGCQTFALQVAEGSDAHRLYLALGFREAFRSPMFARAK